jgi:hypothetical protein
LLFFFAPRFCVPFSTFPVLCSQLFCFVFLLSVFCGSFVSSALQLLFPRLVF